MSVLFNALARFAADRIARKLRDRGWPIPDETDASDILDILDKLRGVLGGEAEVIESLQQPKVCGVPDFVTLEERSPRWPADKITYGLAHPMPSLTQSQWEGANEVAWKTFGEVCGLQVVPTTNYKTAQILVTVGRIDGVNGTLAWSELANGTMRQKTQKYDDSERWSLSEGGRGVYLPAVIRHEGGHAIGAGHLRQGALLQPTYDPRITTFTQIDIDYFQRVLGYGPPKGDSEPPKPEPTDKELFVTMRPDQKLIVTVKP